MLSAPAALVLPLLMTLSGCATSSSATNSFCLIAVPIHGSAVDTEETRRQVDAHNAVGEALCGW